MVKITVTAAHVHNIVFAEMAGSAVVESVLLRSYICFVGQGAVSNSPPAANTNVVRHAVGHRSERGKFKI